MENLDQELKNYYQSQRLSPHKVAAIRAAAARTVRRRRFAAWFVPLAAAVFLAVGIGMWSKAGLFGDSSQRVVAEIVRNHQQQGALVVTSDRYDVVQAALSDLDFPIRPSREEMVQTFALVGGKYCTIQTSRAAQLKLSRRDSGVIHTLYVVPVTADMEGIEPGVYERNGVEVELWTDLRLLYGLAHSL